VRKKTQELAAALLIASMLTGAACSQSLEVALARYRAAKSSQEQASALDAIAAEGSGGDAQVAALAVGLASDHVRVRNHAVGLIGKRVVSSESAVAVLREHCDAVAVRINKNFAEAQKLRKRLPSPPSPTAGQQRYVDAMKKYTDSLDALLALLAQSKELGTTIPLLVDALRKVSDDRAVNGVAVLLPLCSDEQLPAVRTALTEWGTVASLGALCDRLSYFDDSIASQEKRVAKARRKRPGKPPKGLRNKDVWRENQRKRLAKSIATLEAQLVQLLKKRDEEFDTVRQFAKHCKLPEPPAKNVLSGFGLWQRRAAKELATTLKPAEPGPAGSGPAGSGPAGRGAAGSGTARSGGG
tara:strand:+ start:3318 stop:4382 length:1065 start_codon:yes stop_codon:yes gene_type:complete